MGYVQDVKFHPDASLTQPSLRQIEGSLTQTEGRLLEIEDKKSPDSLPQIEGLLATEEKPSEREDGDEQWVLV